MITMFRVCATERLFLPNIFQGGQVRFRVRQGQRAAASDGRSQGQHHANV